MPKTGSTFVRTVISEIYRRRAENGMSAPLEELILPNINVSGRPHDQHGTFRQIPEKARGRVIVSVARNLYDKFLSTFEFGWWAQFPPVGRDTLRRHFPHFPALNLDDYVLLNELAGQHKLSNKNQWNIGNQTVQFIRMYFKDPLDTLERISPAYFDDQQAYMNDMADVVFLRHENLNNDLAEFLKKMGFAEEETALCRSFGKVNVTTGGSENRNTLWTPKALRYVEYNERFLFKIYSDLGIQFHKPAFQHSRQ